MGILNITPDSFSDGGKYLTEENAVKHALNLINDGADIIDIGGESTRPGSLSVDTEEELNRVLPVIKKIISLKPDICISIDTTKSKVAEEAVKLGAKIINDVSGGVFDEQIFNISAKYNVPLVIMHMKGKPADMQNSPIYDNVIDEISNYFDARIKKSLYYNADKIILDPGIGFGKRIEDNYQIIKNIEVFKKFRYPILIGVSRKSFLGNSLDLELEDRNNSTIIAETVSALMGAKIIRTHNVKNTLELTKILHFLNKG